MPKSGSKSGKKRKGSLSAEQLLLRVHDMRAIVEQLADRLRAAEDQLAASTAQATAWIEGRVQTALEATGHFDDARATSAGATTSTGSGGVRRRGPGVGARRKKASTTRARATGGATRKRASTSKRTATSATRKRASTSKRSTSAAAGTRSARGATGTTRATRSAATSGVGRAGGATRKRTGSTRSTRAAGATTRTRGATRRTTTPRRGGASTA